MNLRADARRPRPAGRDFKPVAKKLLPYTARAAAAARDDLEPDRARTSRRDPQARATPTTWSSWRAPTPRLRDIAVGPGGAQRQGARGRAAGHRRGAGGRDAADRVRPALLGRLHRLAGRLLAQRQLRRDRRLQPDRHARERLLVQERACSRRSRPRCAPTTFKSLARSARTTAARARPSATAGDGSTPFGRSTGLQLRPDASCRRAR